VGILKPVYRQCVYRVRAASQLARRFRAGFREAAQPDTSTRVADWRSLPNDRHS
jgi:hypothetical protein